MPWDGQVTAPLYPSLHPENETNLLELLWGLRSMFMKYLVHPKGSHPERNQPWIFIGRTGAETETPILWPPDAKNRLIGKDPDAGKDWRQEKGTTEDELVGWHHQFDGREFGETSGDGKGQEAWCASCPAHGVTKNQIRLEPLKNSNSLAHSRDARNYQY